MAFYLKGVHTPHRKNTAGMSAVKIDTPSRVVLPTVMHIGAPATPIVKVGDHVDVGTVIAEQSGYVSSPVYATVSGKVVEISETINAGGNTTPAIVIESDSFMTTDPSVTPPVINSKDELVTAIKTSGIVGLGGAGFPTYVKFNTEKIEHLIINGAECEPYITSDSVTMVDEADNIEFAIQMLDHYFEIGEIIIAIEKNKPDAIKKIKKLAENNTKITVKVLPTLYPQGAEKVLVYHTTGKAIALGKLPIDVGCVVSNTSTMAAIGKYLKTGMPLVERCITVDGGAVKEPKNVIVPIGTPLKDVFDFCGGLTCEPDRVLYGGPMMGITVPSLDVPVLKNTNAILALTKKDMGKSKTTACIKCGSCANHCPFGINPCMAAKALRNNDMVALEKSGIELCMQCGCCAFVCPARRPIVQNNKLAKAALQKFKAKEANKA